VGSEILSNPVQHVRIKPPEDSVEGKFDQNFLVRRTGWHQDQGVIRPEADDTNMLTVWVPITPATIDNGCLCVIPGSHREGLTPHCPGSDGLAIPDRLLGGQAIPIPMEVGSVLCMHRLTKHSSLSNRSNVIRWSFDLRYQPVGQPTGRAEYPAIVVRSRKSPETEVHDYREWGKRWADAQRALATAQREKKHRWSEDAPICA
jgi:ectoine hydroxylase-related dioxygenase (phytanoyl-CoA dioxygenase family)